MIDVATQLVLLFAACIEDGSTFTIVGEAPVTPPDRARLVVEVEDDRAGPGRPMPLPVRAIVTASDGTHPDGSGRGVYADGRFFADGQLRRGGAPRPHARSLLRSGPDYEPLEMDVEAKAGRRGPAPGPAAGAGSPRRSGAGSAATTTSTPSTTPRPPSGPTWSSRRSRPGPTA